ncbi:MAG: hypothetical protein H6843_05515 [Rhodospirillaceae bacterium]|nr:hypothetical protein [Rhodospirillaceae bacterium]
MTLQDYLDYQRTSLVRALEDPFGTGVVAAHDLTYLTRRVAMSNGSVHPLGRFRNAVFVINKNGHKELWCRAQAGRYTNAFTLFANTQLGFAYDRAKCPGYDVDHLFNRGRVRRSHDPAPADPLAFTHQLPPSTFVRMVLVKSSVNQAFGSMLEKALGTKNDGGRPYRDFTSMQLAKALNIAPNVTGAGLVSNGNLVHIAAEMERLGVLAALGVSRAQMLSELMQQRDFALR